MTKDVPKPPDKRIRKVRSYAAADLSDPDDQLYPSAKRRAVGNGPAGGQLNGGEHLRAAASNGGSTGPRNGPTSGIASDGSGNASTGTTAKVYCYCQRSSFGKMIACDGDSCKFEWFHQECLEERGRIRKEDLIALEEDDEKHWFCEDCAMRKRLQDEEDKKYGEKGKVTYNGMITVTLRQFKKYEATFDDICNYIGKRWEKHLNWKIENDVRKTPVWRSSVRKILLSNGKFRRKGTDGKVFTFHRQRR